MTKNSKSNISDYIEQINFVHCLFQELESQQKDLPMGDYNLIYQYLENARETLEEYEEFIVSESKALEEIVLQFKCEECNKWIDAEEYSYGHDCEPGE